MDIDALVAQLRIDEGFRLKPYVDSVGKQTVGIGRNLSDVGISESEAHELCLNDIKRAMDALDTKLPWWKSLDDKRQQALVNMCFNMGIQRLIGFHNFLGFLEAGDYVSASAEMLKSLWANQVGARAQRLAAVIRGQ